MNRVLTMVLCVMLIGASLWTQQQYRLWSRQSEPELHRVLAETTRRMEIADAVADLSVPKILLASTSESIRVKAAEDLERARAAQNSADDLTAEVASLLLAMVRCRIAAGVDNKLSPEQLRSASDDARRWLQLESQLSYPELAWMTDFAHELDARFRAPDGAVRQHHESPLGRGRSELYEVIWARVARLLTALFGLAALVRYRKIRARTDERPLDLGAFTGVGIFVRAEVGAMLLQLAFLGATAATGWTGRVWASSAMHSVVSVGISIVLLRRWERPGALLESVLAGGRILRTCWLALGLFALVEIGASILEATGLDVGPRARLDLLADPGHLSSVDVAAILGTAIREEVAYRWILFRGLIGRLGLWSAAAGSALVFAAIHPGPIGNQMTMFWTGLCLSVGLARSRSIGVPVLGHAIVSLFWLGAW